MPEDIAASIDALIEKIDAKLEQTNKALASLTRKFEYFDGPGSRSRPRLEAALAEARTQDCRPIEFRVIPSRPGEVSPPTALPTLLRYSTSLNTAKLVGVVPSLGKLKPHCGQGSASTACSFFRS